MISSTPAGRSRQPRTNTRNCGDQPAHQSLLNRRLDGSASGPAHALHSAPTRSRQRDGAPAPNIVDNEHQSFCVTTGCPAACSPPTGTSSITAATPGTGSSTNLGSSCPSASGTGPMHDDQRGLVVDHSCASDRAKARNNTHEAVRKLAPNSQTERENGGLWTETRLGHIELNRGPAERRAFSWLGVALARWLTV